MLPSTDSNQGILILGGQITVTQAVAGAGAQAHYTVGLAASPPTSAELAELRQRLDELAATLTSDKRAITPGQADALTEARAEAAKAHPDKRRLAELMSTISEGAKSVASVSGAIQAIVSLITAFNA